MYGRLRRFRSSGFEIRNYLSMPQWRRKALNSVHAFQDTFFATKELFERHKVVFTVCTSVASVATAWAGYTLRHIHESRVNRRLESIEKAMKSKSMEAHEVRNLVSESVSLPACVATAGTSFIIGYVFGWRGGAWFTNRKVMKEQMKLLGLIKPRRWPLRFLRKPLIKTKPAENGMKTCPGTPQVDVASSLLDGNKVSRFWELEAHPKMLEESGQFVDFNLILYRLNGGSQRGWCS